MKRAVTWGAVVTLALAAVVGVARAQHTGVLYKLANDASLSVGCVEPCLCPIYEIPVGGTMVLTPRGSDLLYNNYAVDDVKWEIPAHDGSVVRITGSGRYRIGGEFALVHQLQLDLAVGDQPVQRFDSGIVVGGSNFPRIDISIAVNGFFCYDSIFTVWAAPLSDVVSVIDDGAARPLLVRPNPFRAGAEIALALAGPRVVDVRVLDVSGREVSTIVESSWLAAGSHVFTWNGRASNGRATQPGVYFVRADIDGRRSLVRVAKLD